MRPRHKQAEIDLEREDVNYFVSMRIEKKKDNWISTEEIYKSYKRWRRLFNYKRTIFSIDGFSRLLPKTWEQKNSFRGQRFRNGYYGIAVK